MTETEQTPPSPPHPNPRSLALEIGIIVIGVLIALAAQQGVDWLHGQADVADTRAALNAELSTNIQVIQRNNRDASCETYLLDGLGAWARGERQANPFEDQASLGLLSMETSAWTVSTAGQGLARMPLRERLAYGRVYAGVQTMEGLTASRRALWVDLIGYLGKTALDEAERRRLLEDVTRARGFRVVWAGDTAAIVKRATKLGAKVEPDPPPWRVPQDCHSLPRSVGAGVVKQ